MKKPNIGYFKVNRMNDHWLFKEEKLCYFGAWIALLSFVNYKDGSYRHRHKTVKFDAGTVTLGIRNIADEFRWSYRRLKRFLDYLEKDDMIELKNTSAATGPIHIIIRNWDKYQIQQPSSRPQSRPPRRPIKKSKKSKEPVLLERKEKNSKFNFRKSMIGLGFEETLVDAHIKIRRSRKAPLSEIAFNGLINQINKSNRNKNWILKTMCENGWRSYKDAWVNTDVRNKLTF